MGEWFGVWGVGFGVAQLSTLQEGRYLFGDTFVVRDEWTRTTPGPSNIKSQFLKILISFGEKCPHNGSKNEPMAQRTSLG